MEKMIQDILTDLYEIDPAWQAEEEELVKIIEKLVTSRPEASMDEGFKEELKAKLLKELSGRKKGRRWWTPGKGLGLISAAAAAILVVFSVSLLQNQAKGAGNPEQQGVVAITREKQLDTMPAKPELKADILANSADESLALGCDQRAAEPDLLTRSEVSRVKKVEAFKGTGFIPGGEGQTSPEYADQDLPAEDFNTEEYSRIYENEFLDVIGNPLSTFSIDVDTASYANVRRFLHSSQLPYPDAVRIEELINYFNYDYPQPRGEEPFAFITEIAACPWNGEHQLLHIGLQGRTIDAAQLPPANLVFLLDTSGSMDSALKLPLLKQGFKLLSDNLRAQDRVAIVTYAGSAGLVLESTPGNDKQRILAALENLDAGGSTAGGAGIELAYKVAAAGFREEGNNRIILATDGDFNVGPSSEGALVRLIEQKRKQGIFLTVLGFGSGNYKDSKMEKLADKGNGNYGYIDSILEARKVLVSEFGATMYTIARDVKLQLEFNPARVKSYRLIGYENRILAAEDFNDDTKDAGEMGAGHTVTALYELIPADGQNGSQDLKYQQTKVKDDAAYAADWLTLKFRYKPPAAEESLLTEVPVTGAALSLAAASDNFRFSAAVAQWGLLLRDSRFKAASSFEQVLTLARGALGYDAEGYREEFISLVKTSAALREVAE